MALEILIFDNQQTNIAKRLPKNCCGCDMCVVNRGFVVGNRGFCGVGRGCAFSLPAHKAALMD